MAEAAQGIMQGLPQRHELLKTHVPKRPSLLQFAKKTTSVNGVQTDAPAHQKMLIYFKQAYDLGLTFFVRSRLKLREPITVQTWSEQIAIDVNSLLISVCKHLVRLLHIVQRFIRRSSEQKPNIILPYEFCNSSRKNDQRERSAN